MKTEEKAKKNKNKFYKSNLRGISLIVLVITIIVIIILAAAVILTLNNNNPITEANKARYESDVANMQAIFTNTVAKVMAQNQGTIEVNAGELNSVKTGGSSAEGRVNYTVNNAVDSSNENGTIIFNTGTNNAITYYTGRMLPLYTAEKTTWYVDSEGVISLQVGEQKYGVGTQTTGSAGGVEGEEIVASDNSMLQSWEINSATDFHSEEYRTKITKIKFATNVKVPNSNIESWEVSEAKHGSVMAWVEDDGKNGYILTIAGKDKIIANIDSKFLFYNMNNLKEIENIEFLDTSNVAQMGSMFGSCSSLENLNLSNFSTENVTSFNAMFKNCTNLVSLDVSSFNTSKATDMNYMFGNCNSLSSLNLNNFDVSNVKSMGAMFIGCNSLENLNIDNFDTSNVTHFSSMFESCTSLKKINTQIKINLLAENMSFANMFKNCNNLTANIYMYNRLNNNKFNYTNMFENAATVSPAQITINYASNSSGLVDNMIATKSSNSNVVKVVAVD